MRWTLVRWRDIRSNRRRDLTEHTFLVPTMADACAGGCQARLLLQVRTGEGAPFTENSPVFRIDGG